MKKIILDKVFVLDLDYQSPLLQNGALTHVRYTQVKLSERVINQTRFEDVYILEPHRYYYFTYKVDIEEDDIVTLSNKMILSGLRVQHDIQEKKVYVYNSSDNLIYVKDKFKIGVIM